MNLYLVVSEGLESHSNDYYEPPEWYRIAELVIARNRKQAIYLAWSNDRDSYTHDFRDMPKFQTRLKKKDVDGPARIVSDEYMSDESGDENDSYWTLGNEEQVYKQYLFDELRYRCKQWIDEKDAYAQAIIDGKENLETHKNFVDFCETLVKETLKKLDDTEKEKN